MVRGGCLFAVVALAASANAGTLWVAFPSGAEPCGYDQLAGALRARLGEVSVRPGVHDVLGDDVDVALERAGSDWRLRVRAADERDLERKLPKPGTDCVATTETAALMVERYLDDIRWTGGGAVVQRLPPLPPPLPLPRWQLVLEAGGAGELLVPPHGASTGEIFGGGGSLDIGVRWGNWEAALSGQLGQLGPQTFPVQFYRGGSLQTTASLQLLAAPTELALGRRFPTGFGAFRLDLTPGAELYWATPSSNLFNAQVAFTALPSLGLRVGYDLPIWRRLFLTLRVEGRVHDLAEFGAAGLPVSVSTGYFDGDAALALGYVFF